MKLLHIALLALAAMLAAPALAQDAGAKKGSTNMEILRQKVQADKKLIVAANMQPTEAEAKGFWPIYDAYQKDLQQINQRLVKAIGGYAEAYSKGPIANDAAKKLLAEALAIEEAELKLKRTYVPQLEKAVSAAKTARYIQIDNKIRAGVRFDLADSIPLAE